MVDAYPLAWPAGWPRTSRPQPAKFKIQLNKAREELLLEIERMGGQHPVISCNMPYRKDGLGPLAGSKEPNDQGVAVYFLRRRRQMVFACDRWSSVRSNMRAITKTIEAMRGIERWGASEMMERAFSAFEALPPPQSPWKILGIPPASKEDAINAAFRERAKRAHPDAGGSHNAMAELTAARDAALKEIGAS